MFPAITRLHRNDRSGLINLQCRTFNAGLQGAHTYRRPRKCPSSGISEQSVLLQLRNGAAEAYASKVFMRFLRTRPQYARYLEIPIFPMEIICRWALCCQRNVVPLSVTLRAQYSFLVKRNVVAVLPLFSANPNILKKEGVVNAPLIVISFVTVSLLCL